MLWIAPKLSLPRAALGPTVDDMTRQAVADAIGRPLQFHQSLYDNIAERFRGFGSKMTENNRQQAYLPAGAILIENPVGTAPSFIVESDRGVVISVPGVPREMKFLVKESAVPYLLRKYELGIIVARILRTAGIGESSLDDQIGSDILSETNPSVGLAAHHGSVDIRVTAKADSKANATRLLDDMQSRLEAQVGEHIFGVDDATLEDVVWRHILRRQLRVHVTEAGLPGVVSGSWEDGSDLVTATAYDDPQQVFDHFGVDPATVSLRDFAGDIAERDSIKRRRGGEYCRPELPRHSGKRRCPAGQRGCDLHSGRPALPGVRIWGALATGARLAVALGIGESVEDAARRIG